MEVLGSKLRLTKYVILGFSMGSGDSIRGDK